MNEQERTRVKDILERYYSLMAKKVHIDSKTSGEKLHEMFSELDSVASDMVDILTDMLYCE